MSDYGLFRYREETRAVFLDRCFKHWKQVKDDSQKIGERADRILKEIYEEQLQILKSKEES